MSDDSNAEEDDSTTAARAVAITVSSDALERIRTLIADPPASGAPARAGRAIQGWRFSFGGEDDGWV